MLPVQTTPLLPITREYLMLLVWLPIIIIIILGIWSLVCSLCCCSRDPGWQKVIRTRRLYSLWVPAAVVAGNFVTLGPLLTLRFSRRLCAAYSCPGTGVVDDGLHIRASTVHFHLRGRLVHVSNDTVGHVPVVRQPRSSLPGLVPGVLNAVGPGS